MEMLKHYLINYVCFQTRKFYRSSNQGIVTLFTICISRDVGFLLYQVRIKQAVGGGLVRFNFCLLFFFWKIEHFFSFKFTYYYIKVLFQANYPVQIYGEVSLPPPFSIFDLNIQIVFYCIKHFIQQIEQVFFSVLALIQ